MQLFQCLMYFISNTYYYNNFRNSIRCSWILFLYSIINIETMKSQLFSGFVLFTLSSIITFGGVTISVVGSICLLVSYIDDITNFVNKKVVPAVNQGVEYITPTVNRVTQSVSTEFNAAKEEFQKKD